MMTHLRIILFLLLTLPHPTLPRYALKWEYAPTRMLQPLSDITATYAIAPNDEGDLSVAIYLIGGCDSPKGYIRHYQSEDEFYCPSITDSNVAFDPEAGLFSPRKNAPRPRYRHAAVAVNGVIWLIGGRNEDDEVIREVDVYYPAHNTWRYLGLLPAEIATSDLAAFSHGGDLFVIGGYDQEYSAQTTTYRIDTEKTLNQPLDGKVIVLETIADLNTGRGDITAVLYGHYAYVMGGFSNANGFCEPLKSVEVFDMNTFIWENLNEMIEGRGDAAVIKYEGKFFVLGGETRDGCVPGMQNKFTERTHPVHTVEMYDPREGFNGRWEPVTGALPDDARYRFVAAPWPDTSSIYVFGGVRNDGEEDCDCLPSSDMVVVYTDVTVFKGSNSKVWMLLFFFALAVMGILGTLYGVAKYRKKKRREREEEENAEMKQLHGMRDDDSLDERMFAS